MSTTRIGIPLSQCWQHARGLRLELAFLRPSVGNALGGCVSNLHSFAPALATRSGAAPRICILSPQCWQHARGLRLELAFLHPSVGNALGGCVSNLHFFAPALATRSGAAPQICIFRPCVGNTLGGCASNWHSFVPALTTRSGLRLTTRC
jgi:hypothetical protein